jgi:hypothetical protein
MSDGFNQSEIPTGRIVTARIWWRKGMGQWVVCWSDGSIITCRGWRMIAGHCAARGIHSGDASPNVAGLETPAAWLEVIGELIVEDPQALTPFA